MIQNLRVVFSHPDILILTGVFIIIIFFIFEIKKYNNTLAYRIIAVCCLWWIMLLFIYPPKGFNYDIYNYNASLTINGREAFNRQDIQQQDNAVPNYREARYLDYTGAQHLLYVILTYMDLNKVSPQLSGFGFRLWTLFNFTVIILLIFYLKDSSQDQVDSNNIWPILFISFCPVIPFYIFISHWEDKLIFLLIPLLLLYLIVRKKYKTASLFLGFTITFNGLAVFFLPVYLIFLYKKEKSKVWLNLGFVFLGIIIALLPFFPESLSAWSNRLTRTDVTRPFWYSIYTFLPAGYYTPNLNTILIIFTAAAASILYALNKINLIDSLIISVSIVILLSPYNGVARAIPLIMLISVLTPGMNRYNWIGLGAVLYIFFLFDNGYMTPVVNILNTFLFFVPVLYTYAVYIFKRVNYKEPVILEI